MSDWGPPDFEFDPSVLLQCLKYVNLYLHHTRIIVCEMKYAEKSVTENLSYTKLDFYFMSIKD